MARGTTLVPVGLSRRALCGGASLPTEPRYRSASPATSTLAGRFRVAARRWFSAASAARFQQPRALYESVRATYSFPSTPYLWGCWPSIQRKGDGFVEWLGRPL